MCAAMPGSASSVTRRARGRRDRRRPRERIVHRHDGVAVARDAAPVAERLVERLAERERRVLRRVVVAGLEVAAALEHEVEARVERELLEEVVVEAGARATRTRDAPSSASLTARRVSAVARTVRARRAPAGATGDGSIEHPRERLDEQFVVLGVEHRDADRLGVRADDDAVTEQRLDRSVPSSTGT